jgi:hypothetical protein
MGENKPTFKGTLSEMKLSRDEEAYLEKMRLERLSRQVAKIHIQTVIGWCKTMSMKARGQSGKDVFADKCDQVVSDMVMVSEEYKNMERELTISRQRNSDMEIKVIQLTNANNQKQQIIERMAEELFKFNSDLPILEPKERSGFNIIG